MKDKKQANIPPLRFAGFSEEWQEKKLGEVGSWDKGQPLGKGDLNEEYGTPCIHYGELFVYNSIIEKVKSKTELPKVVTSSGNDILFPDSDVTPDGLSRCSALEQRNIILGAGINILRLHQSHKAPFCSYSIIKNKKQIISRVTGTTVRHIHPRELSEVIISLPSLAEQEQIGEFFRALDELIGAKEEELEKLRQMKAALLEAMFPNEEKQTNVNGGGYKYIDIKHLPEGFYLSEGSADTPRLRFRGFTEPWQRKKLGELFTLRNGYTPSKANQKYWENGSISWFRMEDIRENGHILKDAIQKVTPEAVKGSGLFPANSFILSTTATIGEHAWIIADSLANQRFTVLSTVNRWETLDIRYFHQYCFLLGEWCKRNVNVGGLNAVNIADLINHHIPLPSLAEQERIGEFFRSQDEGIAAVGDQIERLRAMKQACLERMFA